MLNLVRRHLALKLFLSYLIIIVVGTAVLATSAEFAVPRAFNRHMGAMAAMMMAPDSMGMGMDSGTAMDRDLFSNFRSAVNEA
ncbi:MAG: hypothetical protein GTO62_18800, partial [Planctomycetales bacterium]|nr:hypothetical protein [Planctomycetales bacterium]NIP71247.1 hypothetical protein [Planctomycetales bacterium]